MRPTMPRHAKVNNRDPELYSTSLPIPSYISLADPQYHIPRDVDLIIGNGYLWDLMSVGQHRLGAKLPVLLKT